MNRREEHPFQLYLSSYQGRVKSRIENVLTGANHWNVRTTRIFCIPYNRDEKIHFEEASYVDVFDRESLVYLSAEATDVITDLDESKVYIIGGLVDKNRYKVPFLLIVSYVFVSSRRLGAYTPEGARTRHQNGSVAHRQVRRDGDSKSADCEPW